jgi:hypothetical protein
MADVRCPMCGKPNPKELEECQFCGARIKPILASIPVDSQPIKPGEEPTRKGTSEFEKVELPKEASIHPGDVPTKKNTAELERALPSWLRSLRGGKRPAAGESLAEPSADESLPAAPQTTPGPISSGGSPDLLSGLSEAACEDEEVPDWLAGLRDGKSVESAPAPATEEESAPELGNTDWMARLDGKSQEATTEPSTAAKTPVVEQPAFETSPEATSGDDLPDWLQSPQSPQSGLQEPQPTSQGGEYLPEWLSGLPDISAESSPALSGTGEPTPTESVLDRLDQLKQKSTAPESGTPAGGAESVPDWLSSFGSAPGTPASAPGENVPEWLSNLETKSGPGSGKATAVFSSEAQTASSPPTETPDWLSQLQADVNVAHEAEKHKDDFEVVSEASTSQKGTGPLPEWLTGIEPTTPFSRSTPALIVDNKDNPPGEQGKTAFSMESPDWLSKLNPEQATEKAATNNEDQADTGNLEIAELPSWVQAMRPVESVVETKTALLDESRSAEQSGPLAGLRGVLPAGPGLGTLRKPPAYSTKLQVTDGQHRYAAYLDRLVAGETHSRTVETRRLTSNQLLRWLITVLLFLAVGLPFANGAHTKGAQVALATMLESSDKGASSKIIEGLTGNVPVLVAFDYDPALSGELEAVAAPLMDQLLAKGVPLALISTSPTGPALAEHFLNTTSLVYAQQYQSGVQYTNLGYLAGGPAGMMYFADAPTDAILFSVDGQPAWGTGPLQGIQNLSDFAAVIILTDNADTGRNWIEQAGPRLGNTPMLMMISAQAEPMIQPYFDSGQIKGLVSGLSDAKIYEQTYSRPGLANQYWDSFSIGMLIAELLIATGAVLGVVTDYRTRHKDSTEGA